MDRWSMWDRVVVYRGSYWFCLVVGLGNEIRGDFYRVG